jgi:hypothetical protein
LDRTSLLKQKGKHAEKSGLASNCPVKGVRKNVYNSNKGFYSKVWILREEARPSTVK